MTTSLGMLEKANRVINALNNLCSCPYSQSRKKHNPMKRIIKPDVVIYISCVFNSKSQRHSF
jgi:hypothetical protein